MRYDSLRSIYMIFIDSAANLIHSPGRDLNNFDVNHFNYLVSDYADFFNHMYPIFVY